MLKFLCFVSVLGLSFASFAQENALFPDLKRGGNQAAAPQAQAEAPAPAPVAQGGLPPEQIPSLFANEDSSLVSREQILERVNERGFGDILEEEGGDTLSASLSVGVQSQEKGDAQSKEKKKESSGQFIISPSSVQIVEPSIARFQFCMAEISFQNDTENTLRNLNAIIHYTPIDMPFEFSNVAPGDTTSRKIYMATEGCQKLVGTPPVTINVCQADNMTEEECKASVKYVTNLQMVSEEVQ